MTTNLINYYDLLLITQWKQKITKLYFLYASFIFIPMMTHLLQYQYLYLVLLL